MASTGIKSTGTIHYHLTALAELGHVEKNGQAWVLAAHVRDRSGSTKPAVDWRAIAEKYKAERDAALARLAVLEREHAGRS